LVLTASGIAFVRRTAHARAMTEAEIVRRQESLQILLDSAAEGLFGVDVGGRCTFVNRAALQMLGYDHEIQLLGQPIQQLIRVAPDAATGPSDPHQAEPALEAAARHSDTEWYRRQGGSPFPVERWSHPMLRDGRVQGAVTTFFDISERIRLRNELRRGQILMERLVGSVTDGVITFGDDSCVLLFNSAAERLFLTPAHEALGSPIDRFFDGGLPFQARAHDEPSTELHELTGRRADGSTFRLEASTSRVLTDEGMQNTIVLRDITAREAARAERQAREALEATNRAKTDFLSRMSHELRTPLNAVIGFAQLLRVDSARPPTAQQLVRIDHIEKAGAHLLALVNDVLDLSRIESDTMTLVTEPIELRAAMEEAATMVSPLVTEMGIELVTPSSMVARPKSVWVNADPLRLRQVLVNLLSNAIKYNRPGGSVSVSWRVKGNECEVVITDTGQGMSPIQIERLFEPFNRLGAERSKVEGTGIGLVLTRRLVEMMGGLLRITSTEGEGTIATISLGIARPAAPSVQKPTLPSQHGAFEPGLDVLYAEDNEVNAELVRQIVSLRPAVTLRIAENGRAALQMARARPPDLMLVDMNLGDMTGLEVARALRGSPLTRAIWLVALSADALPEQIDAAMNDGFRDYLTKPVDFRKLLLLLDAHLQTA
jgi:PAS domain S-box-containing protein